MMNRISLPPTNQPPSSAWPMDSKTKDHKLRCDPSAPTWPSTSTTTVVRSDRPRRRAAASARVLTHEFRLHLRYRPWSPHKTQVTCHKCYWRWEVLSVTWTICRIVVAVAAAIVRDRSMTPVCKARSSVHSAAVSFYPRTPLWTQYGWRHFA